jgi:hypothetical protein
MNVENAWWYIRSRIRHHWVWSQHSNGMSKEVPPWFYRLRLSLYPLFYNALHFFLFGILVPARVPHRCNVRVWSIIKSPNRPILTAVKSQFQDTQCQCCTIAVNSRITMKCLNGSKPNHNTVLSKRNFLYKKKGNKLHFWQKTINLVCYF